MMRLSFSDMRKFRDPRTGEPLREGTIFNTLSRGTAKELQVKRGDLLELYDQSTDRKYRARALSVRLTYLQALGTEELSWLPMPNIGTPAQFVKRLQARYRERMGSILTLIKLEIVS